MINPEAADNIGFALLILALAGCYLGMTEAIILTLGSQSRSHMTKRTEHLGNQTGKSSDKHMSPQRPYTGDGRTSRQPHDPVTVDYGKK